MKEFGRVLWKSKWTYLGLTFEGANMRPYDRFDFNHPGAMRHPSKEGNGGWVTNVPSFSSLEEVGWSAEGVAPYDVLESSIDGAAPYDTLESSIEGNGGIRIRRGIAGHRCCPFHRQIGCDLFGWNRKPAMTSYERDCG